MQLSSSAHHHRVPKQRHRYSGVHRVATSNVDRIVIGLILSNGRIQNDEYRCAVPSCRGKPFGRLAELKRHHDSVHGGLVGRQSQFWCPIDGCESTLHVYNPLHHFRVTANHFVPPFKAIRGT